MEVDGPAEDAAVQSGSTPVDTSVSGIGTPSANIEMNVAGVEVPVEQRALRADLGKEVMVLPVVQSAVLGTPVRGEGQTSSGSVIIRGPRGDDVEMADLGKRGDSDDEGPPGFTQPSVCQVFRSLTFSLSVERVAGESAVGGASDPTLFHRPSGTSSERGTNLGDTLEAVTDETLARNI